MLQKLTNQLSKISNNISMPKYGERIGEGGEKIVYPDPIDPENKVRIELKRGVKDNAQTIGRYYLQKITHLLFPENTSDIYLAGTKPIGHLRMQRIKTDPDHEELQRLIIQGTFTDEQAKRRNQLQRKAAENPKVKELIKKFNDAGLYIDTDGRNFSFDKKGDPKYLDSHGPWNLNRDGTIDEENFDDSLLIKAIQQLSEQKKEEAFKYFKRLTRLKEQIIKNQGKGTKKSL
jgi:hypothetical protein